MNRKTDEELWQLISENFKDLWFSEEIFAFNKAKSADEQIDILQRICDRLPDAPTKEESNNPTIQRNCDFKKALKTQIQRQNNSWLYRY
ncbi:MAG: hypothetical protein PHG24_00875 [Candidatus Pacebacteria bacterium]|nr:hypothetical protein [Candidatus Paceibacterota bacterium]